MKNNIKLIILFGSRATGKAGESSDTDIAVLADHPLTLKDKMKLAEDTANRLNVNEDKVDIVDIWHASPLLQYQVAQYGKLLEGDNFDFTRFKVLAWKRYLDTSKFRRAREKALEQYVKRTN